MSILKYLFFKDGYPDYLLIGVFMCLVFLGFKHWELNKNYDTLNILYIGALETNAANTVSIRNLEDAIGKQNEGIEKYKNETAALQKKISEMSTSIQEYNNKISELESQDLKSEIKSNDEAIEWLKSQASSLR